MEENETLATGKIPRHFNNRYSDPKGIVVVPHEPLKIERRYSTVNARHSQDQLRSFVASMLVNEVSARVQDLFDSLLSEPFAARFALNESFGLIRNFGDDVDSSVK